MRNRLAFELIFLFYPSTISRRLTSNLLLRFQRVNLDIDTLFTLFFTHVSVNPKGVTKLIIGTPCSGAYILNTHRMRCVIWRFTRYVHIYFVHINKMMIHGTYICVRARVCIVICCLCLLFIGRILSTSIILYIMSCV